ncbi:amidase [Agaricicola taiwanensis]|uniref:Amidase n=1 Tax=Agaricicola taiwanensis TaxID=591372 RepID=A0A8J3DZI0_9RHOB|nr:acetamidase/formamidase family protein [Agaricicola taiwanensis]GGE48517.1 amidase [Agaricicola taiwanensis]
MSPISKKIHSRKHVLQAGPKTVHWGYFDGRMKPRISIPSGDRITISTLSGSKDVLPEAPFTVPEALHAVHASVRQELPGHICTGPVFVEGAEKGGVLQIDIEDIRLGFDWGYTVTTPLMGILPNEPTDREVRHIALDRDRMIGRMPWGTEIPLSPFFGVMTVAPPPQWGRLSTLPPRRNGGNMDNRLLTAGTTLYLPVFVDGALFSVGDGHGAQGDGEVCETALETGLEGTFRLTARNDIALIWPRAETADTIITMAFDPDLDICVAIATQEMIDVVTRNTGLSRSDAYALCSLVADLRVTQVVNGNRGAHMVIDKRYLRPTNSGDEPFETLIA